MGLNKTGVAIVLSTIKRILFFLHILETSSILRTSKPGFPIVSPNIILVLFFIFFLTSDKFLRSTKLVFIPNLFNVSPKRFLLPP